MSKSKPTQTGARTGKSASTMSSQELAHRTILGLDRLKPFDQLSVKDQLQVLRNEIKQLRSRLSQQNQTISKLSRRFANHAHTKKGKVYLELQDVEHEYYETGAAVDSDFDPLR